MSDRIQQLEPHMPVLDAQLVTSLEQGDLNDLCDATDAAIESGGGFGWLTLPARDILERYWQGVMAMPTRMLFVARLDGVICGTCQLIKPPPNNEAQRFAVQLTTHFVAPWGRGYGLAPLLLQRAEITAHEQGYTTVNLDVRATQELAIKLYEGAGYKRFGTHPHYAQIDGEDVAGHYYFKEL